MMSCVHYFIVFYTIKKKKLTQQNFFSSSLFYVVSEECSSSHFVLHFYNVQKIHTEDSYFPPQSKVFHKQFVTLLWKLFAKDILEKIDASRKQLDLLLIYSFVKNSLSFIKIIPFTNIKFAFNVQSMVK